jgi:predicted Fe-S protein YdhL (DUF1289 family)
MSDNTPTNIPSPCISLCALNEEDVCVGCYRTAEEITEWTQLSQEEKKAVIEKAYSREKLVNPFL